MVYTVLNLSDRQCCLDRTPNDFSLRLNIFAVARNDENRKLSILHEQRSKIRCSARRTCVKFKSSSESECRRAQVVYRFMVITNSRPYVNCSFENRLTFCRLILMKMVVSMENQYIYKYILWNKILSDAYTFPVYNFTNNFFFFLLNFGRKIYLCRIEDPRKTEGPKYPFFRTTQSVLFARSQKNSFDRGMKRRLNGSLRFDSKRSEECIGFAKKCFSTVNRKVYSKNVSILTKARGNERRKRWT